MNRSAKRRAARVSVIVLVLLALATGIAYATIPDANKVYTACVLKNVGTIRLIDPSLPSSNLMSHCSSLETQVSWNQQAEVRYRRGWGNRSDRGDRRGGTPGAQRRHRCHRPAGSEGRHWIGGRRG
jgi:hypothetical protein